MTLRVAAAACAVVFAAALPVATAIPAGAADAPTVASVGGVTVVQQNDAAASLVGVSLVVRAGLDRQTMKQSGLAALTAETILRTPVRNAAGPGMPLETAIAAAGGSVHFAIDPDDVRFYVEALAADAPQVLGLFRTALAAPDFSPATVRDARTELVKRIAESQDIALQVGLDMLSGASAQQANAGLPSLGSSATLAQIAPADVAAFYKTYYRSGGAVVSAVGHLDSIGGAVLTDLASALPAGTTSPVAVQVAQLHGTSRELVTHRDISSPWLIAEYPAPSIDSKDFGPMLVLASFLGRTLSGMADVPGAVLPTFESRSVGALYSYDRQPPRLVLYVNGGIGNPSRTFAAALSVVNILAQTKLQGSIDDFKAAAAGDFATGATTLESRAWLASIFAQENASPDFLARAIKAIDDTTPADVQRVARTYLGNPTIALVLPREAGLQN